MGENDSLEKALRNISETIKWHACNNYDENDLYGLRLIQLIHTKKRPKTQGFHKARELINEFTLQYPEMHSSDKP